MNTTALRRAALNLDKALDASRETGQDQAITYGRVIAAHEELKLALKASAKPAPKLPTLKRGTDLLPKKAA
jgi:hypothetical protein